MSPEEKGLSNRWAILHEPFLMSILKRPERIRAFRHFTRRVVINCCLCYRLFGMEQTEDVERGSLWFLIRHIDLVCAVLMVTPCGGA